METEGSKVEKEFVRKLNKQDIPVCPILGVNVAAINMEVLMRYISDNIENLSGDYICVSNVHTTVLAYENPDYSQIQNDAIMAIPDGGPLSKLGRIRGYSEMGRTAGPDLMVNILAQSDCKYRHFFLGSTEETLRRIAKVVKRQYPNAEIAGMCSPPFRTMTEEENTILIEQINATHPDFVWVGLGAPKQEMWMAMNCGQIEGLMIGVGYGFELLAGNRKRAPKWMQKCNLEWLYRLIQEPGRLFWRYFYTNIKFILHAVILGK